MKKRETIADGDRLLHRVVPDVGWVDRDFVSQQAFTPRSKDKGCLSTADKGCSAEEALADWRRRFPRSSANRVLSVTVRQCVDLGLRVYDDSPDGELHVSVDFNAGVDAEAVAESLARGCKLTVPACD